MLRKISLLFAVLLLAGCAKSFSVEDVNALSPVELLQQYRRYAQLSSPDSVYLRKESAEESFDALSLRVDKVLEGVRPEIRDDIKSGRVVIGMSPSEVRMAWGNPNKINESTYVSGRNEQWVWYTDGRFRLPTRFVYFEKDKVTSVHQ